MIQMTNKTYQKVKLANMLAAENLSVQKSDAVLTGGETLTTASAAKQTAAAQLLATNYAIQTAINYNIQYTVSEIAAGQSMLLQLSTTANRKVVFHSYSAANLYYQTTVFYIEDGVQYIVEQSTRLLSNFDVDAFISLGGTYYIQVDILSGTGDFTFVAVELEQYSSQEVCDNLYDALALTPGTTISATDFFDNRMDFDFYAMETTEANQTVYVNFAYTGNNIMNPYQYNPAVGMSIFYLTEEGLFHLSDTALPMMTLDKAIDLPKPAVYYFALWPNESLPLGQMTEAYTFSVGYDKLHEGNFPSSITINLSIIEGAIDDGTYDVAQYSSESMFWVNGTAVRLNGLIENWAGGARKCKVKVTDMYESAAKYGMAYLNANGTFEAVIPLFKTTAREQSFTYHNETMDWNVIEFINDIEGNGSSVYITFNRLQGHRTSPLKIGVCYNDYPLYRD